VLFCIILGGEYAFTRVWEESGNQGSHLTKENLLVELLNGKKEPKTTVDLW